VEPSLEIACWRFLLNANEINRPSASTLFCARFGSMRALRQCLSTAALTDGRARTHDLGRAHTAREFLTCSSREPDGRGLLAQVRLGGGELASHLTETEAAA
jgi:hypothetical protein